MAGKYDKNFTKNGYIMNYRKGESFAPYKNYVLQFKIELSIIEPLIWRRILVPSDYNFWDLHVAIQDSMGWLDYHLHHFKIKGKGKRKKVNIGITDFNGFLDDPDEIYPGWEIPVLTYFNELGVTAQYIYDYGDEWIHSVMLEGYIYKARNTAYPECIGGERACPPEDCGGESGYYEILKALSDISDENYENIREWIGQEYDPDSFHRNNIKFHNPFRRWEIAFLKP